MKIKRYIKEFANDLKKECQEYAQLQGLIPEYEVRYKRNHELMAFFSVEENDGFVAKNYIDSIKYKTLTRWLKGLKTHRDIQVTETDFVYS